MKDSNNIEIRTGDIVQISGAYFKTSNGLFYVSDLDADTASRLYLHRVKKNGEICVSSASSVQSWPLSSYCSDSRKNYEAKKHNAENAKIEIVSGVNPYYVAEHFKKEADGAQERAEELQTRFGDTEQVSACKIHAAQYRAVYERLSAAAVEPKQKEPEKGVKFYYNGIKVDGGRLIPCHFWFDENSVSFSVKGCNSLPREYFTVKNNSDPYSDYFDDDHTTLTAEHPLYKYARYVALKGVMTGKSYRKPTPEQEAEWSRMKDPGQPTSEDLKAVEEQKLAAQNAMRAKEQAERLAAREESLRKISEGHHFCESVAAEHPVIEGQPKVKIGSSESPYLYSFSHGADNIFSVAAAEIILKHFDDLHPAHSGYDKTDFVVLWNDEETGEAEYYEGRYDLGDHDGGLIEHIRSFGRWHRTHDKHNGKELENPPEELSEIEKLADWLEEFTAGGRIVSVEVNSKVVDFYAEKKRREEEEAKHTMDEILEMVGLLTDEQIESAIFNISPTDKDGADVARFFLQELMRRDEKLALDVFRRWKTKKEK